MTSFANPRSSKASPLEPEDVPHSARLYPGDRDRYRSRRPHTRGLSTANCLQNRQKCIRTDTGSIFLRRSGTLVERFRSVFRLSYFFQILNELLQHQTMPFQWLPMPSNGASRRQGDCDCSLYPLLGAGALRTLKTHTPSHTPAQASIRTPQNWCLTGSELSCRWYAAEPTKLEQSRRSHAP